MHHDDGGAVWVLPQGPVQPAELRAAEHAGGVICLIKGVKQDPVHEGAGEQFDVLFLHLPEVIWAGEGGAEVIPMVVIAQRGMDLDAVVAEGLQMLHQGGVIFLLAIFEGAVAIDEDAEGLLRQSGDLPDAAVEVLHHAVAPGDGGGIGGDVGVGEEDPGLAATLCGGAEARCQYGGGGSFEPVATGQFRENGDGHGSTSFVGGGVLQEAQDWPLKDASWLQL